MRRAVVFIRELVPRRAIAWVAREWYNEPYRALPMRHSVLAQGRDRLLRYELREGGVWTAHDATLSGDIAATYGDACAPALTGSPRSAFVAEGSSITVFRPRRLHSP